MDFPMFDGSDVRIWLDKCAAYFQLYAIPQDFELLWPLCIWWLCISLVPDVQAFGWNSKLGTFRECCNSGVRC
jgi:hypothetical protein